MTLRFQSFRDVGDAKKERVVLVAEGDVQIGDYAILGIRSSQPVNETSAFHIDLGYWFPNLIVKQNDVVVIYSKSGEHKTKTNEKGVTSYFFYLEKDHPIWSGEDVLVVTKFSDWHHFASYGDESVDED
jgi:hypothetical protein